jgi:putative DNA primase/helicase
MTAARIAAALGDGRREGSAWRCRCPLHGGRSLVLRDGYNGLLLLTCWAGCDRLDVLTELRRRGLLDGRSDCAPRIIPATRPLGDQSRTSRALKIWRGTERAEGSIVELYLAGRGIRFEQWLTALRFHPRCPRPKDEAGKFVPPLPAMIALVEHIEHGPVAVHCTYLRLDGSAKAGVEKAKAIFGPVAGGSVRFGAPQAGQWLAVAEGIETALSVAASCSMPVWAALSAGGIKNLRLPREATHIVICADHDANGVGERAAHDAAERWLAENRRVRIATPPEPDTDFNDLLNADGNEVRHVP